MMKNFKFLVLTFIAVFAFTACQEDDDLDFVANEATDLVFNTSFLSNYVLNPTVSSNLAERFTWDNADFGVATNVTYSLQGSTLDDFSDYIEGDALYNLGNTTGNEIPVTIGQMIDLAEAAGLVNTAPDNTGILYFRLIATIGDGSLPSMSAVQGLNVELQESTTMEGGTCEVDILYAVGAGLPTAGWDWATPVELMCSADGVWSGNVEFTSDGDANFRFFTAAGDWATGRNYPFYADAGYTIDSNFEQNTDDDLNFKFVGTSGVYFLTIDTNSLEITLGPPEGSGTCEVDTLYGVGAGLTDTGWDWGNPGEFSCVSDGIWSGTVNLQNNGGADNNFRFFTILDDWASGRNYPYYADAGYAIDADLVQAMDDDLNFAFVGTSGSYTITIDTNNLTISLTPAETDVTCEFDILYGVGAGLVDTGWDWATPGEFTCTSNGVWSGSVALQSTADNNNFRFFTVLDDWATGRNYPYYIDAGYTIDADLVDAGDDDNNFAFVGTDGTYTITIDTNNLTITLD